MVTLQRPHHFVRHCPGLRYKQNGRLYNLRVENTLHPVVRLLPSYQIYQPAPYLPLLAYVLVYFLPVIFGRVDNPANLLELRKPFHQGVVLPDIQTKLHLYRPLRQLYVSPLNLYLHCSVAPGRPLVIVKKLLWRMNDTFWAPWKGGRLILQDHHLVLPMHVHEVLQ